jgi:hypothetical protein
MNRCTVDERNEKWYNVSLCHHLNVKENDGMDDKPEGKDEGEGEIGEGGRDDKEGAVAMCKRNY